MERAVPAMILIAASMLVGIEVGHLGLGDLTQLILRELSRPCRAWGRAEPDLMPQSLLDQDGCRRGLA